VPWIRQLVAGLSVRRPGFDPRSVLEGFVVNKVAVGQVFVPVFRISPVSIIPTKLHNHLHLHTSITGRINGCILEISPPPKKNQNFFGNLGALDRNVHSQVFLRVARCYSAYINQLKYTKLNTYILGPNLFTHWYKLFKQNLIIILSI
jgi:hypothetical protein